MDVSKPALVKAKQRLMTHGKSAEFIHIDEVSNILPIASASVDFIHSSGVLHHCSNLSAVLFELHRILKPGGTMQVMVYNYQSIWLHLYTAYIHQLELNKYQGMSVLDAFRKTTDGSSCPVSHCYMPSNFIELVKKSGFSGIFKGASISAHEMKLLDRRYDAICDFRLPREHRDFLSELTFDEQLIPHYRGEVAGINACYDFIKN